MIEAEPITEVDADLEVVKRWGLKGFVELAWPIIEPSTTFIPNWHLDVIAEHLEAVYRCQINDLLINMPPRHCKSIAAAVMFPAYIWTLEPSLRWLYSSYAQTLSIRDSVKMRRLIESYWYQERWGDRFQLTSDQNQKIKFENDKSGYRMATSVGGSNTGEGADVLVVDDGHNVEQRESDTIREGVIDWWSNVMSTRINNPKKRRRIVIMQRVHERDLAGHLLEQGGWTHLNLPAEYEGGKCIVTGCVFHWAKDPRTEEGEPLWSERFGKAEITALKKDLGEFGAAAQLQQRPAPAEGGILKRHWWRYWCHPGQEDTLPPVRMKMPDGSMKEIKPVPLPYSFDKEVQSWDMAFKDLATSSYVVGHQWGLKGPDSYLKDQVRAQMDFTTTLEAVRAFNRTHKNPSEKAVEDKANGPAIISVLKKEIPGMTPHGVLGDKQGRAAAYAHIPKAGNCFLPHPAIASWVEGFINECATFPNAEYDDQCFAAGTMIATLRGDRPIETIQPGEYVVTPFGIRRVLHAGQTGMAEVLTVRGLTATSSHKVFTYESGWCPLNALTQAVDLDRLTLRGLLRWTYRRSLSLTGSTTTEWGAESIISAGSVDWMDGSIRRACTSLYGNLITSVSCRKVGRFITRILTRTIMTLAIFSVYRTMNTVRSLILGLKTRRNYFANSLRLNLKLRHGIEVQRDEPCTSFKPRSSGIRMPDETIPAKHAARYFGLASNAVFDIARHTVATVDEWLKGNIPSLAVAHSASNHSQLLNPSIRPAFALHVAPHATPSLFGKPAAVPVYNLEVEHDHVYYANGVLVKNCDTWSQAMDVLYKVDDPGVAITPEYAARFHVAQSALEPVQGCPSFRFWYQGLYPCCIIGQILSSGRILLIDCLLGEQNGGIEDLIDRKVLTVLAADYKGCTDWRDITNHAQLGTNKNLNVTEHRLDQIIHNKVQGFTEAGEPDFFVRVNAIKGILAQTGRLTVNPAPTPGEEKPWIHEALSGGYSFRRDQSGVISKSEPRKFHPLTSVGEALGHGLCRIFVRKPMVPPKFNKTVATKRARQYSV